jgi:tetratricopeptide (TPR) repeat protein
MNDTARFKKLKKRLSSRLVNWPMLRLLLFDPWFRLVLVGLLFGSLVLALALPRIWRTTPSGFKPIVRVSGLDVVQAWSLRRSALRASGAGNPEAAEFAWHAAIANNPANLDDLRGYLRFALEHEGEREARLRSASGYVGWLLRLSGTNAVDTALAVEIFSRLGQHREVLDLVRSSGGKPDAVQEKAGLKALFHLGAMAEYRQGWERARERLGSDPELILFETAYLAGWGPPGEAGPALQRLDEAAAGASQSVLVNRLRMQVAKERQDLARLEESLRRLVEASQDVLQEHTAHWELLAASGRLEDAQALARAYVRPLTNLDDVGRLSHAFRSLNMRDEEIALWQQEAPRFGQAPRVWIVLGDLLMEARRWDDLRIVARQIRDRADAMDVIGGYSYFLEGRAEIARGRWQSAEEALVKAAQLGSTDAGLRYDLAQRMMRLGYARPALELLLPLEAEYAGVAEYWQLRFGAHAQQKEWQGMVEAAQQAYALAPEDLRSLNNQAAMWLMTREPPERIQQLTLELMRLRPQAAASRLNHALALIRNHRPSEAAELLRSLAPHKFTAEEDNAYIWCWMEYYVATGQPDRAREEARRLDPSLLFAPQVEWLQTGLGSG